MGFITSDPTPLSRYKARQNSCDGHQFGTQALDGAFDGGLLNIDALLGRPGGKKKAVPLAKRCDYRLRNSNWDLAAAGDLHERQRK